jgi:ADP-ribosylglycohydrolase
MEEAGERPKRAWELEHETMAAAVPVLRGEDEQTWNAIASIEQQQSALARMMWLSHVPGSGAPERLLVAAVQALENRGLLVPEWQTLIQDGLSALEADDVPELLRAEALMHDALARAVVDTTSEYWASTVYDSWEQFVRDAKLDALSGGPVTDRDFFMERTKAAWMAQVIGGALGTSIEGYTAEALKGAYGDIRDYLIEPSTYNDDITFEIAFLKALERSQGRITATEIGLQWVSLIPFGWSAELIALRNLQFGLLPPESARFRNPFSEWIGSQMRGAVCGMVAPGDPRTAARLAWMDGSVSHTSNGIIGEVFNALMVSQAYVESDVRAIVASTVGSLPPDAEYTSVVRFALSRCLESSSWESAWNACEEHYKRYNWVHAYPNACAEVVALWFGNGDFDETLRIVAMAGQDVDCNAAQIMTVVLLAATTANPTAAPMELIPSRWRDPIGDTLDTYVRTMKKLSFDDLTEMTVRGVELLGYRFE